MPRRCSRDGSNWRATRDPGGSAASGDAPATAVADASPLPILKGGRIIGPLERLLIAALALAGAFTVVAALFAAKGIVRFPEISRDPGAGDRAEYFLVGSMVSWTIAFAAAGLLWFAGGSG